MSRSSSWATGGRRRGGVPGAGAGAAGSASRGVADLPFRHRQQARRDHHDRRHALVGRAPQQDPDAVPGGQPGHHEQAEPLGVGQVELRRFGDPPVERLQLGVVEP